MRRHVIGLMSKSTPDPLPCKCNEIFLIFRKKKKCIVFCTQTGILVSLPKRKLLIVPKSPSCDMGKASLSTLVRFNKSK